MPKTKPILKIDWATHQAAKYACKNWHYSKSMPVNKTVKIGAWEDEKFIGVVIFSRGANRGLYQTYNLKQTQGCELTRIALTKHKTHVSRILKIAIMFLKKSNPNLELIISFADTSKNHHGGVYQATNWIYVGLANKRKIAFLNGKQVHERTLSEWIKKGSHTKNSFKWVVAKPKHKYLFPLKNKEKYLKLSKPYPKRVEHEINATKFHLVEGGAVPTDALQFKTAVKL